MKKFLLISALALVPSFAIASTASLSPASITLAPGQSTTLTIFVDPQGSTAYTAKVAVSFDPALVSVTSFTQASGWLPLTQPGYDLTDNSNGSLIKTGGMAGGFTASKAFGTITLTAKQSGSASVSITGATQILDAQNQNTFTSGGRATIAIAAPAPIVAPVNTAPATTANPKRELLKTAPARTSTSTQAAASLATSTATTSVAASAAAASGSLDKVSGSGICALAAAMSFFLGVWVGKRRVL